MMRTIHWLFVVSVALFLSGIGFLVAGARPGQQEAAVAAPLTTPVADVKQIMNGIVGPAAGVVFGAVGTIVTVAGTQEKLPKTDEEWASVGNSAAALVESGNLLMMGSRAIDKGDWIKMSQALMDSSVVALKAVEAKDAKALFASGDAIYASCNNCHMRYQRSGD